MRVSGLGAIGPTVRLVTLRAAAARLQRPHRHDRSATLGGTPGANGENVRKMRNSSPRTWGVALSKLRRFVPEDRPDVIVRHVVELIHTLANNRL